MDRGRDRSRDRGRDRRSVLRNHNNVSLFVYAFLCFGSRFFLAPTLDFYSKHYIPGERRKDRKTADRSLSASYEAGTVGIQEIQYGICYRRYGLCGEPTIPVDYGRR